MLVLDSGGVTKLAAQTSGAAALILALKGEGLWPPTVPSAVLVECLAGDPRRDAGVNRFLKTCDDEEVFPVAMAREAARIRRKARRGSAVDALVVATAQPNGVVLTGDVADLGALASHAENVTVERV